MGGLRVRHRWLTCLRAETAAQRKELQEFVNEVLPEIPEEPHAASSAGGGDGASVDDEEDDDGGSVDGAAGRRRVEHFNTADMLRRRWSLHLRFILKSSSVLPAQVRARADVDVCPLLSSLSSFSLPSTSRPLLRWCPGRHNGRRREC